MHAECEEARGKDDNNFIYTAERKTFVLWVALGHVGQHWRMTVRERRCGNSCAAESWDCGVSKF